MTRRVWNRLRRIPGLSRPLDHLEDAWSRLCFATHPAHNRRQREVFWRAGTPSDIFNAVARVLPPHQRPFEIMRFMELARSMKASRVLEIGTGSSGTHLLLLRCLPQLELAMAVDLFIQSRWKLRYFGKSVSRCMTSKKSLKCQTRMVVA